VVAKDNKTHEKLSEQLRDKSMGRYYLALIDCPLKDDTIIDKPIGRNPKNRLKMDVVPHGKTAKTAFVKLAQTVYDVELIAAKLFTGRTHQIRVHLKSLSRHILNDYTYGYKSKKDTNSRVMLHAYLIYFIHPKSGKLIIKEAPLFEDFIGILSEKFNMETIDEKTNSNTIINSFTHYF
jgi:23S rRNA pseudouridine1911/1915/1917 synthase